MGIKCPQCVPCLKCSVYRLPCLPCCNIIRDVIVKVMSTSHAQYPLFTLFSLTPIRHYHIIPPMVANKVCMRNVTVLIYYLISSVKCHFYGLSLYKFYILHIVTQWVFYYAIELACSLICFLCSLERQSNPPALKRNLMYDLQCVGALLQ